MLSGMLFFKVGILYCFLLAKHAHSYLWFGANVVKLCNFDYPVST